MTGKESDDKCERRGEEEKPMMKGGEKHEDERGGKETGVSEENTDERVKREKGRRTDKVRGEETAGRQDV